jgi:hypothetical protein
MKPTAAHFVDIEVPEAVLLPVQGLSLANAIDQSTCGAVWYHASRDALTFDAEGAVTSWRPQDSVGISASPAEPNAGNLKVAQAGGLAFQSKINAGMVVPEAMVEPTSFTLAVRFTSEDGEARSLLTVNPNDHDTYLFLSEREGLVSWQDQQDEVNLSVPSPVAGGWVIGGYHEGVLSLATAPFGGAVSNPIRSSMPSGEIKAAMKGASDLFIGCRSHRKGILKTLGASRIHDILLWVDQDHCSDEDPDLQAALRFCETMGAAK